MTIILSTVAIVAAWVLLFFQADPVPTWFYVFAWYPTLVLLDAVGTRIDGRPSLLWRRPTIFLFLWSPSIWFLFEVANFRLENWYYISLPHMPWERWCGIVLSFATVVPALVLAERLLDAAGLFKSGRGPTVSVKTWELNCSVAAGIGMGGLALIWPRLFFPLIWGAVFLLVDPLVFRVDRSLSLLGDIARGYWGRIGRLLVGGLGIGLLWECYNFWARGKWVYTVPWLEETKLFEMPPFGFVGFPVFTLEAWSLYAALCLLGVAAPLSGKVDLHRRKTLIGLLCAAVFSGLTIAGMERRTISSTVPQLAEVPGIDGTIIREFRGAGITSTYDLASADPDDLSNRAGLALTTANTMVQTARLATLRGIGDRHARTLLDLGIETVCELAEQDATTLFSQIDRNRIGPRPNSAEVRVWISAAARACSTQLD